jgi:cardiolipin synthase
MIWTVPNLLSLIRLGLVPVFVVSVLQREMLQALVTFLLAGLTDALDGAAARWWRQQTRLGAYLDPAADKLLLVSAYVVLSVPELHEGVVIPTWITALVLTRDVAIVVVSFILYLAHEIRTFRPSTLSKLNTAMQVVTVLLVLLASLWSQFVVAAHVALWTVAFTTVASGLDYIRRTRLLEDIPEASTE